MSFTTGLQNFPAELLQINTTYLEYDFLVVSRVTCIQNGSLIDLGKSSLSNQAVHVECTGTFKRLTTLSLVCKLHGREITAQEQDKSVSLRKLLL